MRRSNVATLAVLVGACGAHGRAGEIRYRNTPPVWLVNDRKPVARAPAEHTSRLPLYYTDSYFVRPVTRTLDLPLAERALDVNSLDEVPDSTWFTNRIGVRDLSLDEVRAGVNKDPSPIDFRPWKITGAKVGGLSLGFVFEDSRGTKFLLKFDDKKLPEAETGAHIICHRILSALGYNVPQDYLGRIRREDLVIAPDATKKDPRGRKSPLTTEDIDRALETIAIDEDGSFRVLVSALVPGKPLGGYAIEGTRGDDPNDLIPHELRRSIRGQYPIFAWLNHTDIKEHNTLDAYVDDPANKDEHYVLHYLIDFGKALGVYGVSGEHQTIGHTYQIDPGYAVMSLFGLGLWKRPWEDAFPPGLRGIGLYEAVSYRPGAWRPQTHYWPLEDSDRFDAFWGAKLMIRLTREQLTAIVDEAHYADPRASAYMVDTLIARQRATARYWFARVAPLDGFTVDRADDGARVCFDDLMLVHALADVARGTQYRIETFGYDGHPTAGSDRAIRPDPSGRTCVGGVTPGATNDDYTIVRFTVQRSARAMPPVLLHLARDAAGALQIIGLRRE